MSAPGAAPPFKVADFLFNASGRSGRWAYAVGQLAPAVLLQPLVMIPHGPLWTGWVWIGGFASYVIMGTLTARRLHDLGKAGWWLAWITALFAVALIPKPAQLISLSVATAVTAFLVMAVLAVLPGEKAFNRFGPPPPPLR